MNATDFRAVAEVFSQMLSPSSSVLTTRLSDSQDLDGLHIRRDTLHEEHGRPITIASAMAEAESSIAAIDCEITHLAAAERGDIERWADQGTRRASRFSGPRTSEALSGRGRLQPPICEQLLRGVRAFRGGYRTSARTFLSMLTRLLPALTRRSRKLCAAMTRSKHCAYGSAPINVAAR